MENKPLHVFDVPLSGVSLVEASAGTGKTYNITSLYVRAVLEMDLVPSQILVMTFTEAATAELKFRLRSRLVESLEAVRKQEGGDDHFLNELLTQKYDDAGTKLKQAIDSFDEAAVFTIHGFCSRLLKEYSLQFGVSGNFELLTNEEEVLQDCVDDYWRSFVRTAGDTDMHTLLLDFLTDNDFGPDELSEVMKQVLDQPSAILLPHKINEERLMNLSLELKDLYIRIQELWEQEKDQLAAMYNSDGLKKNIYQASTHESDWLILLDFIQSGRAPIGCSDRLEKFGLKINRSMKKSAPDYPELDLSKALDAYLQIAEELKLLKVLFIKQAYTAIQQAYSVYKKTRNLISYNDLLTLVNDGLTKGGKEYLGNLLRTKYPLALVDEFQDTDPVQYAIFEHLYARSGEKALFMIGDPKQAIYGFRGADIFTYLRAKEQVTRSQAYKLEHNFRSNKTMIRGVNALFSSTDDPFLLKGLQFEPVEFPPGKKDGRYLTDKEGTKPLPLQCISVAGDEKGNKGAAEEAVYDAVVAEVVHLLSGKYELTDTKGSVKVREKDIAILIRKGSQGEALQARLREVGLKSVLKSRRSVFDTQEADELFRILKAVRKISYEPGIRSALSTEMLGYTARELASLQEEEGKWAEVIRSFLDIHDEWEQDGIVSALELLIRIFRVREKLALKSDAERRITNLLHLIEQLEKAQRENELFGSGLMKWFFGKLIDTQADSEDEQIRLESDEDLIQISTMHASKGLEYPIVLCPFLWDSSATVKKGDIFKFHRSGDTYIDISQKIDHKHKEKNIADTEEQLLAEEVRLSYVALTRSISACLLFIPDYNDITRSPLATIVGGREGASTLSKKDILQLLAKQETIQVRDAVSPSEIEPQKSTEEAEEGRYEFRQYKGPELHTYPRMLSYSALSHGNSRSEDAHDYDEGYRIREATVERMDKMGFPKGANAGTFLHKLFEDLNFQDVHDLEAVVTKNLEYYGFEDRWAEMIGSWVQLTLDHELNANGLKLKDLHESDILKEMEFYFPVAHIEAEELWALIREGGSGVSQGADKLSGFMKGFIDLTFRAGNKYYILDYKSNHLGDDPSDYASEKLGEAMIEAGYDLQYHIYTLALHRFLKQRMKDYHYEEHFGGVMYLYLRGMVKGKSGSGVYFDRPQEALIQKLDAYMREGGTA